MTGLPSVLIVEDELKVRAFIKKALEQEGMQADSVTELSEIDSHLARLPYDILLLDRMWGRKDSLALIPKIRKQYPLTKIFVLSALGDTDERVEGLQMGADDYLPKPFHVAELTARINSLVRRSSEAEKKSLFFNGLEIKLQTQEVFVKNKKIDLTAKEFKLLSLMASKPNRVFSKMDLLDRVWGINFDPESNVVEVAMKRLRQKIDVADAFIHNRRGSGYWFGTPEE